MDRKRFIFTGFPLFKEEIRDKLSRVQVGESLLIFVWGQKCDVVQQYLEKTGMRGQSGYKLKTKPKKQKHIQYQKLPANILSQKHTVTTLAYFRISPIPWRWNIISSTTTDINPGPRSAPHINRLFLACGWQTLELKFLLPTVTTEKFRFMKTTQDSFTNPIMYCCHKFF